MSGFAADLQQVCGCSWAAVGNTMDELNAKVKQHALETHNFTTVPGEIAEKLHKATRPTI